MAWTLVKDLTGKVYIVTGTSSGIGTYMATHLAKAGATVVGANRNVEKAKAAHAKAAEGTEGVLEKIEIMECDMSSFESVRKFAAEFQSKHEALDGIIHNAGAMMNDRKEGVDGHEMMFTVTNASPQLMNSLLVPQMLKAKEGATVVVTASQSSMSLTPGKMWDDLEHKEKFNAYAVYSFAKAAALQQRDQLRRVVKEAGKEGLIRSVGSHPGMSATSGGENVKGLAGLAFRALKPVMTHPSVGSLHAVRALVDAPDGSVVGPNKFFGRGPPVVLPAETGAAVDPVLGKKVWDYVNEITGADWSSLNQ